MAPHLRIARPVSDLARTEQLYRRGLELTLLDRFENHQGFDGVMLGAVGAGYHFEFTMCRTHRIAPTPTSEDLVVFYLPEYAAWRDACAKMAAAGFKRVTAFNPYWDEFGCTFADPDGYRIVLQNEAWSNAA
jgi:catechol 2,3-dioxygenase-like lactoylglutathione lyase family enzyme